MAFRGKLQCRVLSVGLAGRSYSRCADCVCDWRGLLFVCVLRRVAILVLRLTPQPQPQLILHVAIYGRAHAFVLVSSVSADCARMSVDRKSGCITLQCAFCKLRHRLSLRASVFAKLVRAVASARRASDAEACEAGAASISWLSPVLSVLQMVGRFISSIVSVPGPVLMPTTVVDDSADHIRHDLQRLTAQMPVDPTTLVRVDGRDQVSVFKTDAFDVNRGRVWYVAMMQCLLDRFQCAYPHCSHRI